MPVRCRALARIDLSVPTIAAGKRPIFWYFPFHPILDFTNYIRSPLFMYIRLAGSNTLLGISVYIRIVIDRDGRCLLLLTAFSI